MKDLTHPTWIKVKGMLFLLLGLMAAASLLLANPGWRNLGLIMLTIWCFCRAYYFAFYVIEKYVDPSFKFSGLGSFVKYLWSSWRRPDR